MGKQRTPAQIAASREGAATRREGRAGREPQQAENGSEEEGPPGEESVGAAEYSLSSNDDDPSLSLTRRSAPPSSLGALGERAAITKQTNPPAGRGRPQGPGEGMPEPQQILRLPHQGACPRSREMTTPLVHRSVNALYYRPWPETAWAAAGERLDTPWWPR